MTKKKPVRKKPIKKAPTKKAPKKIARARALQTRDPERRYVFRGNAAAFGGQLYRPEHIPMGAPGSCIPSVGGVSQASTGRLDFGGGFVTIGSTSTTAEGRIDDLARARAWTDRPNTIRQDSMPTTTRAGAELRGLVVRRERTLQIGALSATIEGKSPLGRSEPAVRVLSAVVDGLSVDGFGITVELNTGFFQQNATKAAVLAGAAALRKSAPRMPPLFERNRIVYCTIVRDMRWTSGQPDRARIEGNAVIVDNLGTFYIGEIMITDASRRLTMFRAVLGSPDGGDGGGVDIDINGGWSP